jgi:predicted DNA-binding protein (MmcQ/YjbR family)
MDVAAVRAHCLAKPRATEGRPFGPGALVMKVAGKIFAIIGDEADPPTVSLKCEPEVAAALREMHAAVAPGYHLNKRHWNTVTLDGSIPGSDVLGWIDDSFDLVVDGLPRRVLETRTEPDLD